MVISQGKRKSVDLISLLGWFFLYSFIGWLYETLYCSFQVGHFVSRGFLLGPFIPIYGLSIVSGLILFSDKSIGKVKLFISCAFIASVFEYLTSLWMEFVFHKRWWDYSHQFLNFQGRVCLEAAVVFGLLGVLVVKYLHPNMVKIVNYYLPNGLFKKGTRFILLIFVVDVFASFLRAR